VSQPTIGPWGGWPTEPGQYLCYGKYIHNDREPCLDLCKAVKTRNDQLLITTSGAILYTSEWHGVFAKFDLELPELPEKSL